MVLNLIPDVPVRHGHEGRLDRHGEKATQMQQQLRCFEGFGQQGLSVT
jgi:hypothetical protein